MKDNKVIKEGGIGPGIDLARSPTCASACNRKIKVRINETEIRIKATQLARKIMTALL